MYSLYNVIAIYMNNNAIINNSYGRAKDLILLLKIFKECQKIWFKFLERSGMRTKTFRQNCSSSMSIRTLCLEVKLPVFVAGHSSTSTT